ncbi:MAG: Gfo/Idh/MocA family oxidoreductase [Verrucomicrobiaceae bacterium]
MNTRRQFVTGLAAVSTIHARTALGSQANSRVKVGLIGCGQRGNLIANLFRQNGYCEVAAAADYFPDRAEAIAKEHQFGSGHTHSGLKCAEKLIAKGGVDAVAIISPPWFHPEQAKAAVEAGLHVYLAKPMAVDVPGCQSIEASAAKAKGKGLTFLIDFQTRTDPYFIECMRRAHSGMMGKLGHGEAFYHAGRLGVKGDDTTAEGRLLNWVFHKNLSGDIIVEQNIHTLDVMNWAMNNAAPVRVTGLASRLIRTDVGDNSDTYSLVYEYAGGVGITFSSRQFDSRNGAPGGITNHMHYANGALLTEYGGQTMIRGGKDVYYSGGKSPGIYKDGIIANIAAFQKAIAANDTSNSTIAPSIRSNLIAIMGRLAGERRAPVTWDELMASPAMPAPDLNGLQA